MRNITAFLLLLCAPCIAAAVVNGDSVTVYSGRLNSQGKVTTSPSDPQLPPASNVLLNYTNITTTVIDVSPGTDIGFWSGIQDINGDGCEDIFIGTHSDNSPVNEIGVNPGGNSSMFLQNTTDSSCDGDFSFYDRRQTVPKAEDCDTGYSQDQNCNGLNNRITARYIFGNWYNNTSGLWSFVGSDADGSASSSFRRNDTTITDAPNFTESSVGCAANARCIPAELTGSGNFEIIQSGAKGVNSYSLYVTDAVTGAEVIARKHDGTATTGLAVADFTGDGYPDVVDGVNQIFYAWDSEAGAFDETEGAIPDAWYQSDDPCYTEPATGSHQIPMDCDIDGDMDIIIGKGQYSPDDCPTGWVYAQRQMFTVYLNNGSGVFTHPADPSDPEVAEPGDGLINDTSIVGNYYATTYMGIHAGDVNWDGYPDFAYGGQYGKLTWFINNGNCGFTRQTINVGNNTGLRPWTSIGSLQHDGRLDVVNLSDNGSLSDIGVYKNQTDMDGYHYVRIAVKGDNNNTDGLHTQLNIYEAGTNNILTRRQVGVFSIGYADLRPILGVGQNTSVKIEAVFPHGGGTCTFDSQAVDKTYKIFKSPSCQIVEVTPGGGWPQSPP